MIRESRQRDALWALHDLLVVARTMAFEKVDHRRIADFMDALEVLPTLVARDEDLTDVFASALEDIAVRFPEAAGALQRFEGEVPT
jgi:hypothetical protein